MSAPVIRLFTFAAFAFGGASAVSSAATVTGLFGNSLFTFDSATPGVFANTVGVTGLTAGDSLVAIDYRPVDGKLVGFGYNASSGTARVYTLDTGTGLATSINANTLSIGVGLSVVTADFNPTANALRVVTGGFPNNNFRIGTAATGALATDTALSSSDPNLDFPSAIVATAYSRNVAGGGPNGRTTLFEIDGVNNSLVIQGSMDFFAGGGGDSPNNGNLTEVIGLTGINGGDIEDLDIFSTSGNDVGTAFVTDGLSFFGLDLTTGVATSNGMLQSAITDFAVIPEPSGVLLFGVASMGALFGRRRRGV